ESHISVASQSLGLAELITQILQTLGEPTDLAPLLRDVIPWLPIEESERTRKISKHARHNLLKALLIQIVRGISEKVFLVLAFDEIQVE
ncbi:hypothetical protein HDU67_007457, partial [Dinochytrium kinnereticum]